MIQLWHSPWLLALILIQASTAVGSDGTGGITIRSATDKPSYYQGEVLEVRITINERHTLDFATTLQSLYTMDGVYTPKWGAGTMLTQRTTPFTWSMLHNWDSYKLRLGDHSVAGRVVGYGAGSPAGFAVIPTPQPSGDFVLDFQSIPGTSARIAHLMAYEVLGVRFRTSRGAAARLQRGEGGAWVEAFDPYPIGFHVIADLDPPVFGASSKVAGGLNVRITMIAKNAQGRMVATAVSAPVVHSGKFAQTLSVRATEPIASLEWWPSESNCMTAVDDLLIITSPIVSHEVTGSTLRLTWTTVAGTIYQLWSSPDLETWSPLGPSRMGGGVLTNDVLMKNGVVDFFRVSRTESSEAPRVP